MGISLIFLIPTDLRTFSQERVLSEHFAKCRRSRVFMYKYSKRSSVPVSFLMPHLVM